MELETLAFGGVGCRTPRGSLGIWTPALGFVITRIAGHGEKEFSEPIITAFERCLEQTQSVRLFFDTGDLVTYDSDLRLNLTGRFLKDRKRIANLDVLVRSKLVAMGVSVANLALGGIVTSHAVREPFSAALDRALVTAGATGFSSRSFTAA